MKNIGFLIIILVFLSCEKDKTNTTILSKGTGKPGKILYHDIQPDTLIHSVKYFANGGPGGLCVEIPFPSDSSVSIKLDINGDSINDFIIYAGHYISTYPPSMCSSHCNIFAYVITIQGVNAGDSISSTVHENGSLVPYNYKLNEVIKHDGTWLSDPYLLVSGLTCYWPAYADFGDTYIGVKVNKCYGWIHVAPADLNGIIIKEYAVNLTENNSIKAGQVN